MHRRTAYALRPPPTPSPRIDFSTVASPPGWGKVIPFVLRRKTTPPKPVTEKLADEMVSEITAVELGPDAVRQRAEAEQYQRFLMGLESEPESAPPESYLPTFVGIVQKPVSQKDAAKARNLKKEQIDKALKAGRKVMRGAASRGGGRGILSSSHGASRQKRASGRRSGASHSSASRTAKQVEPLPALDDALFFAKAEHAWKRCNPPRMPHHKDVLTAALSIRESAGQKTDSVQAYLVECLRLEIAETQEAGEQVTHGLLRRIVDRSLGLLIKWVWDCVKRSEPYESRPATHRPHRRDSWVRKRSVSVALNRFSIHVCRHPALTGDREAFFLLERADTGSPIVHMLMSEVELGQWLRKLKPCCLPASPARLRSVDDGEDDIAS